MVDAVNRTQVNSTQAFQQKLPPIKKEEVEVDASYQAATLEIRTRNPEMTVDWDSVREEMGFLKLYGQVKEINSIAKEEVMRGISQRVQSGLRLRNLHMEKGNVFGKIAFNEFLASRNKTIEIAALPKFGVNIDVRIYPPEIKVEAHVLKGVMNSESAAISKGNS